MNLAAPGPRARAYCWTANEDPRGALLAEQNIRYAIWQHERAPTTGHEHWQGYLQLREHKTLRWCQLKLGRWHFEQARGTLAENKQYCSKAESRIDGPWEMGSPSRGQGERSDLAGIAASIVEQFRPLREIACDQPSAYVRYHRGFRALQDAVFPPEERKFEKIVTFEGPTGIGKSFSCRKQWPGAFWMWESDQCWTDGYMGEEVVILDEFCGTYPIRFILELCSEVPLRMPYKGGFVACRVTTVVITSNHSIRDAYRSDAWHERLDRHGVQGELVALAANAPDRLRRNRVLAQLADLPRVYQGERSLADLAEEYLPVELRRPGQRASQPDEESIDLTGDDGDSESGV